MRDLLQTPRPVRRYGEDRTGGAAVVWETDADGQQTGTGRAWPRALPAHRSPCRHDASKGVRQHRCSRSHAELVEGYRSWREAEYAAAEDATSGYATELAEYWSTRERPTLKAYLIGMRESLINHLQGE